MSRGESIDTSVVDESHLESMSMLCVRERGDGLSKLLRECRVEDDRDPKLGEGYRILRQKHLDLVGASQGKRRGNRGLLVAWLDRHGLANDYLNTRTLASASRVGGRRRGPGW